MTKPNVPLAATNPGRVTRRRGAGLVAGAVLAVLLAGCVPPAGVGGTPHPDPTVPSPWIIDHLEHRDPSSVAYTAYCAPLAEYNPAHVPSPDQLTPVPISAADYARLQIGDRCPVQSTPAAR